jgi:hypothetical protein
MSHLMVISHVSMKSGDHDRKLTVFKRSVNVSGDFNAKSTLAAGPGVVSLHAVCACLLATDTFVSCLGNQQTFWIS